MKVQNPDGYVSKQISVGNSVTVPSGEIWKVTMTYGEDKDIGNDGGATIELDGEPILKMGHSSNGSAGHGTDSSATLILTGGDTIDTEDTGDGTFNPHVGISGFRIQDTVDNTPVQERISTSNSVSVPSGETWLVYPTCGDRDPVANSGTYVINVNGDPVLRMGFADGDGGGAGGVLKNFGPEMILKSGDTVSYDTYDGVNSLNNVALFGWKI